MFAGYYQISNNDFDPPPEGDFYIVIRLNAERFDALYDALLLDNNPIVDASNFDALAYRVSVTDPLEAGGGVMILENVGLDVDIVGIRLGYNVALSQNTTIEITATGTLYIL